MMANGEYGLIIAKKDCILEKLKSKCTAVETSWSELADDVQSDIFWYCTSFTHNCHHFYSGVDRGAQSVFYFPLVRVPHIFI